MDAGLYPWKNNVKLNCRSAERRNEREHGQLSLEEYDHRDKPTRDAKNSGSNAEWRACVLYCRRFRRAKFECMLIGGFKMNRIALLVLAAVAFSMSAWAQDDASKAVLALPANL